MVIPKTEIRYSYIYNKQFDSNFSYKDKNKLQRKCRKFGILYKKYIKQILKEIEKSQGKWKRKYIPIYIVEKSKTSFSDPLTLKYQKNPKLMLVIMTHELLHNNLSKKFKSTKELHKYMEPILNKIIKNLKINLNKELNEFNSSFRH